MKISKMVSAVFVRAGVIASAVAMTVGAVSCVSVNESKPLALSTIHIKAWWDDAKARDVENKVTQVIEEAMGRARGVRGIKSETKDGAATISLQIVRGMDTEAVHDVSNILEDVKKRLPYGAGASIILDYMPQN